MSADVKITELDIGLREATTRYVQIACKSRDTGNDFDFSGYTVQTHLAFGPKKMYVPSVVVGSILSYKIPAEISVGVRSGVAETRIFKDGDVFEVLRINVAVAKAVKPDVVPNNE